MRECGPAGELIIGLSGRCGRLSVRHDCSEKAVGRVGCCPVRSKLQWPRHKQLITFSLDWLRERLNRFGVEAVP